ncbi:MAG TPA: hypothetical protein VM934_02600, partial [Pyrinomonadaceae bacterium]|nr:hypothetical protein [Pyrinomonadaceae bacterium]
MKKSRPRFQSNSKKASGTTGFIVAAVLVMSMAANVLPQRRNRGAARSNPSASTQAPTGRISENTMRAHIKYLSDDLLEGRGPGTRGGELAAKYIAAQFEALGLRGGGPNGSFFQPVSLVGVNANPKPTLTVSGKDKKESFKFADDFVAFTGAQTDDVSIDADLVFV